jgi:hypothetical protein
MGHKMLKLIRFVVPAAIILIFASMLGAITGLYALEIPDNFTSLAETKNLVVLVLATLYYALPLRNWANKKYSDEVNENLRTGLVRISRLTDKPDHFTWAALRGIFYPLIDSDPSLGKKSEMVMWNGAVWTSFADLRALSLIFVVLSVIASIRVGERGIVAAGIFIAVFVVTILLSRAITNRHMRLGDEQLEIIEHNHQGTLRTKMEKVLERAGQ